MVEARPGAQQEPRAAVLDDPRRLPRGRERDEDLQVIPHLPDRRRQRLALARAIYGSPDVVVLDEPNASLDERGEKALLQAILELKARGTIVVIVTHRTDILQVVDLMLVLRDGQTQAFGPKDQVLAALKKAADEQRAKMEEARARAEQARLEAPPAGEPAQGASA